MKKWIKKILVATGLVGIVFASGIEQTRITDNVIIDPTPMVTIDFEKQFVNPKKLSQKLTEQIMVDGTRITATMIENHGSWSSAIGLAATSTTDAHTKLKQLENELTK